MIKTSTSLLYRQNQNTKYKTGCCCWKITTSNWRICPKC